MKGILHIIRAKSSKHSVNHFTVSAGDSIKKKNPNGPINFLYRSFNRIENNEVTLLRTGVLPERNERFLDLWDCLPRCKSVCSQCVPMCRCALSIEWYDFGARIPRRLLPDRSPVRRAVVFAGTGGTNRRRSVECTTIKCGTKGNDLENGRKVLKILTIV